MTRWDFFHMRLMLFLLMFGTFVTCLNPSVASALTVDTSGINSLPPSDVYIDVSKIIPENMVYSLPSDYGTTTYYEPDINGYHLVFYTTAYGSYGAGDVLRFSTLTIRYPHAAVDGFGRDCDVLLHLTPTTKLLSAEASVGRVDNPRIQVLWITNIEGNDLIPEVCSRFYSDTVGRPHVGMSIDFIEGLSPGTSTDLHTQIVLTGTNTVVSGTCGVCYRDLDRGDNSFSDPTGYDGEYAESVELGSGFSSTVYVEPDHVLVFNGNRIHGTQTTGGSDVSRSGFSTIGLTDSHVLWRGTDCGTLIFESLKRSSGNLRVSKVVDDAFRDKATSFSFRLYLNGQLFSTFSLSGGESRTFYNIAEGVSYEVVETNDADFATSWTGRVGSISQNNVSEAVVTNRRRSFVMTLTKASDWPELVQGHALYSLAGAQFTVKDETGKLWASPVSSADGSVTSVRLPTDHTYTVSETSASPGHVLPNPSFKTVSVGAMDESARMVSFANPAIYKNLDLLAYKIDADNDASVGQGDALDWTGFRVQLDYYQNYSCSGSPSSVTVWGANSSGKIFFGAGSPVSGTWPWRRDGRNVLPLGSYRVHEVQAPVGYRVNGTPQTKVVRSTGIS